MTAPLGPLRTRILVPLMAALVLAAITALLVIAAGAPWRELSATPDEASHFVTSLMIRSYLIDGLGTLPHEFAMTYYLHYPKVAFGIWPPTFHFLLAGWMFLAGTTLATALVFVSLITVTLGVIMFCASRAALGSPLALLAAAWFIALPAVQESTTSIMIDMQSALLMIAAAILFGRYLNSERRRDALWFALCASAAILTKNNAFALALVPPLAIAISGRWHLVRRREFWTIPLIVAVVCAPWFIFSWQQVSYAASMGPAFGAAADAARNNSLMLAREPGPLFIPLVLLGLASRLRAGRGSNGLWVSLGALVVAVWTFHSLVYPLSAPRYLLPAMAGIVLFAVAGSSAVADLVPYGNATTRRLMLAVAMLALFAFTTFRIPIKPLRGFAEVADVMLALGLPPDTTALVSSDTIGEGAFISHIAAREPTPRRIILRASKLLATSTWWGRDYSERFADRAALSAALDRARVEYIAIDDASREPHHERLQTLVAHSTDWVPVVQAGSDERKLTTPVHLYRRRLPLPPGEPDFEIDLSEALGTTLRR